MPTFASRHSFVSLAGGSSAIVVIALAVACDGNPVMPEIPASSCSVSPRTLVLTVGDTQRLGAAAFDKDGVELRGTAFVWTSANPLVVSVGASSGVLAAVGAGTAAITAQCGRSASGSASVTVSLRPLARVEVAPTTAAIVELDTLQLRATATDDRGATAIGRAINWTSDNPSVATVDSTGRVIARSPGAARISAAADGRSGVATLSIGARPVASLALSPTAATIPKGEVQQFAAVVRDAASRVLAGRVIAWNSSAPAVASVSPSGVVTALAVGSATITAQVEARNASAVVTVVPGATVARVDLTPATASIPVGRTQEFVAIPRDSVGRALGGRVAAWNSAASHVATISSAGIATAASVGSTTITVTIEGKSAAALLGVTPVPVAVVEVLPVTGTVKIGQVLALSAVARDSAGNTLTGRGVVWSSSAISIATVTSSGVVTGVAEGTANIRATVDGVTGSTPVAVTAPTVARIAADPSSLYLAIGGSAQLTATAYDAGGLSVPGKTFTWASSNSTIVTVSASGVATGVAAGNTTVTASANGVSGQAYVTVRAVGGTYKVTTSPVRVYLRPGDTQQLSATALDNYNFVVAGRTASWVSNDATVATVSTTGLLRAVGVGRASISASIDGKSSTVDVTVLASWGRVMSQVRTSNIAGGPTCALTQAGEAFCWGSNTSGQLGDGTTTSRPDTPGRVAGGLRFSAITLGDVHACALSSAGSAYCWGSNASGQLGDGSTTSRLTPTAVTGGHQFVELAAGGNFTCGIKTDGSAWCWGNNDYGQLGVGSGVKSSSVPLPVVGGLRFRSLSVQCLNYSCTWNNDFSTCGITTDAGVACWGERIPYAESVTMFTPVDVSNGRAFTSIVDGGRSSGYSIGGALCGLGVDGRLWCVGAGSGVGSSTPAVWTAYDVGLQSLLGPGGGSLQLCGLTAAGTVRCTIAGYSGFSAQPSSWSALNDQPALTSATAGPGRVYGVDTIGRIYRWDIEAYTRELQGPYLVVVP